MSAPFQFKEFAVAQDQCAMKIGTDGVLLGAWATSKTEASILDIGTGTGVIALQLAQRSAAEIIDAIEIDGPAFEQAVENFENSPWGDRLFGYHASLQEFAEEIEDCYELIVSNPPFYTGAFPSEDAQRNKARFEDALPFAHLLAGVSHLLAAKGRFALIIPFQEETKLIESALPYGLHLQKCCRVRGNQHSPIKRSLLEFSFSKTQPAYSDLQIETERHVYTKEYIELVQDFYLKM
jgi:tRNA1Val (adenine37-N6)-methyltransferase